MANHDLCEEMAESVRELLKAAKKESLTLAGASETLLAIVRLAAALEDYEGRNRRGDGHEGNKI